MRPPVPFEKKNRTGHRRKQKAKRKKKMNKAQGPLFGFAYHPLQVSSFGSLVLPSLEFGEAERFTAFM